MDASIDGRQIDMRQAIILTLSEESFEKEGARSTSSAPA